MINTAVSISHVLLSAALIALILFQRGKGAEAGAAFGAGASGTVFGAAGSGSFLTRLTGVLAALFFATSLALAYLAGQVVPTSVLEQAVEGAPVQDTGADFLPVPDGLPSGLPAEIPTGVPELVVPDPVPPDETAEPDTQ